MPNIILKFKNLIGDNNWEEIKSNLVMGEKATPYTLSKMESLIQYRDNVDYIVYCMAIDNLFPERFYDIKQITEYETKQLNDDELKIFKSGCYLFEIRKKPTFNETNNLSPVSCLIRINTTGSRTVTSTLDASIMATLSYNNAEINETNQQSILLFLSNASPTISNFGMDYESHIANAVIDGFFKISESLFNMTPAENRDSNAYLDTTTNEFTENVKFNNTSFNNPIVGGSKLFTETEFDRTFCNNKLTKHIQEQAASLFLLGLSLNAVEWESFKFSIFKTAESIFQQCFDSFTGQNCFKENYLIFLSDMNESLKLTEFLVANYKAEMSKTIKSKIAKGYAEKSPVKHNHSLVEKDLAASAMNELYVKYLHEAAIVSSQIMSIKQINHSLLKKIDASLLSDTEKLIRHDELTEIKNNLRKIADLNNKKQLARIMANSFSNKAYTNRAAVYHVVRGMQEKLDVTITEQVVMGSALQQVGFKLLHMNELYERGKDDTEICYLTAKYGYRIFNLVYHDKTVHSKNTGMDKFMAPQDVDDLIGNKISNKIEIMGYLKSKKLKSSYLKFFTKQELHLLNSEAQLTNVKKQNIPDNEKPKLAMKLMRQRLNLLAPEEYPEIDKISTVDINKFINGKQKAIYINIAVKILSLTYASRLDRKKHLWGNNSQLLPEQIISAPPPTSLKPNI